MDLMDLTLEKTIDFFCGLPQSYKMRLLRLVLGFVFVKKRRGKHVIRIGSFANDGCFMCIGEIGLFCFVGFSFLFSFFFFLFSFFFFLFSFFFFSFFFFLFSFFFFPFSLLTPYFSPAHLPLSPRSLPVDTATLVKSLQ